MAPHRKFFTLQAAAWAQHELQKWYFWFLLIYVVLGVVVGQEVSGVRVGRRSARLGPAADRPKRSTAERVSRPMGSLATVGKPSFAVSTDPGREISETGLLLGFGVGRPKDRSNGASKRPMCRPSFRTACFPAGDRRSCMIDVECARLVHNLCGTRLA